VQLEVERLVPYVRVALVSSRSLTRRTPSRLPFWRLQRPRIALRRPVLQEQRSARTCSRAPPRALVPRRLVLARAVEGGGLSCLPSCSPSSRLSPALLRALSRSLARYRPSPLALGRSQVSSQGYTARSRVQALPSLVALARWKNSFLRGAGLLRAFPAALRPSPSRPLALTARSWLARAVPLVVSLLQVRTLCLLALCRLMPWMPTNDKYPLEPPRLLQVQVLLLPLWPSLPRMAAPAVEVGTLALSPATMLQLQKTLQRSIPSPSVGTLSMAAERTMRFSLLLLVG
jgi:hypothetical protein